MRENIGLFKAKIKDKNEWTEGFYTQIIFSQDCFENEIVLNGHFIISKDEWWAEIDPETLCECAGLTDKNGKKIFEGDVVRYNKKVDMKTIKATGEIIYNFSEFVICEKDTTCWGMPKCKEAMIDYDFEVIGNKFDAEVESD